eukprot:SAG31_NODE_210_length_20286_cov_22.684748_23_plen_66_part_00
MIIDIAICSNVLFFCLLFVCCLFLFFQQRTRFDRVSVSLVSLCVNQPRCSTRARFQSMYVTQGFR